MVISIPIHLLRHTSFQRLKSFEKPICGLLFPFFNKFAKKRKQELIYLFSKIRIRIKKAFNYIAKQL